MRRCAFAILLLLSVAFAKVSSSDKCYRFEKTSGEHEDLFRQYYFNKKGVPVAHDLIMVEREMKDGVKHNKFAHYYHSELYDCTKKKNTFTCTEKTVSVWFRIYDLSAATAYQKCDPIFQEKFADITKYGCTGGDPFQYDRAHINTTYEAKLEMYGNVPLGRPDYRAVDSCEINKEIIGVTSNTTIIIIVSCCVVIVLILLFMVIKMKKSGGRSRSAV